MDLAVYLFWFILSITSTSAFHSAEDYHDFTSEDLEQTRPVPGITQRPTPTQRLGALRVTDRTGAPPVRFYEVTEQVDDIPNPNPGPLTRATNFTVNKPLNFAGAINTNNANQNVVRENPKFRRDFTDIPIDGENLNSNLPKETEFEVDDIEDDEHRHEDFHNFPDIIPIIKTYLAGLERGIVNGVNGLVGKNVFNVKVNEPLRATTPVWFLNKLKHRNGHSHDYGESIHRYFDYELDN